MALKSRVRASPYELGNRAGSVTGTNFVFLSHGRPRRKQLAKGGLHIPKTLDAKLVFRAYLNRTFTAAAKWHTSDVENKANKAE